MSEPTNPEVVIHWRIPEWFPDLSGEVQEKLKVFHTELIKVNRTLSLISAKTISMADAIHFADSILASRIIAKSDSNIKKVFDLGSGAGFPGVVYGLLNSQVEVVLVESDAKKCDFLKHLLSMLKSPNITILNQTAESLGENSMKYAMARGFTTVSKAILSTRRQIEKGGVFFHIKGDEWGMEVSQIPTQLCSIWSPALVGEYKLPIGAMRFAVVKTEKIA